ncbi:DUF6493 family protein [Oerskovia turbata]
MPPAIDVETLLAVPRADVLGLLHEHGEDVARRFPAPGWGRQHEYVRAVGSALESATEGARPAAPCDVPPTWLAPVARQWVEMLSTTFTWHAPFLAVRALERLGAVSLEAGREYVLAFVGGVGAQSGGRSRVDILREDPELFERAFWPMFETEGGGQVSLTNVDKFASPDNAWQGDVLRLVAEGDVDRQRLLDACLGALARDLGAFQAGWFSRTLRALEPDAGELGARQSRLLDLVRSLVPATVTFAVDALRGVEAAGLMDDDAFATGVGPATGTRSKATALAALRLLDVVSRRRPDLAGEVALAARPGLEHAHRDVRERASAMIDGVAGEAPAVLTAVAGAGTAADRPPGAVSPTDDGASSAWPESPAVPTTVAAPAPARSTPPAQDARPVVDGELVERTAVLLEDTGDALEIEQVLAALARSTDLSVLEPLRGRARAVHRRGVEGWTANSRVRGHIARLVLVALGEQVAAPVSFEDPDFLVGRLDEVAEVLHGAAPPLTLLATPTRGPWVEPSVLVARLLGATDAPRPLDLVAALLRLAPDGRPDALRAWEVSERPEDEVGGVVRYALGGAPPDAPLPHGALARSSRGLWVAAARARDPLASDDWLRAVGIEGPGRSEPLDARVDLRASAHGSSSQAAFVVGELSGDPTRSARPSGLDEPTAAWGTVRPGSEDLGDWLGWHAILWPHDAEHFLLLGGGAVLFSAWGSAVRHDAPLVLDLLLTHQGRLGRLAALTVMSGLASYDVDHRVRAADLFEDVLATGRLSSSDLAEALVTLAPWCVMARWGSGLGLAAAVSAEARRGVVAVLTLALPGVDRRTRGVHALLERLLDECGASGAVVRDEDFVRWARGFPGTSRAGRLARELLAR